MRVNPCALVACCLTALSLCAQQGPPVGLPPGAKLLAKPVPRRMTYFVFLRRVNDFDTNAASINPGDPGSVKSFFQAQTGLGDADYAALKESAAGCVASVGKQDAEAQQLIESIHAQTPGGRLAPSRRFTGRTPLLLPRRCLGITLLFRSVPSIMIRPMAFNTPARRISSRKRSPATR